MIPLSYAQRRLWFLNELEGVKAVYNTPLALRLTGALDVEALRGALADLVARHESLRTVFREVNGEPHQHIREAAEAVPVLSVEDVPASEVSDALLRAYRIPFDLADEIPLRAQLFRQGPDEHVLLITLHHIAGDGWSMVPLWRDVSSAYAARLKGEDVAWEELPVQYADYTLWQREVLGDDSDPNALGHQQMEYWKAKLDGIPEELVLPTRGGRPAVASRTGVPVDIECDRSTHARLAEVAGRNGSTVFMALQAALGVLLSKLGAGHDVPIGTAIAGRTDEALHDLVGFFVNTLVLRTDTSGDPSFLEVLQRVRTVNLEAYENQDLPFERLVETLNPPRVPGRHPLFQVMLTLQNNAEADYRLHGVDVAVEEVEERAAQFDIAFLLKEEHDAHGAPAGLRGTVLYSEDLFTPRAARWITERFRALLDQVVEDPQLRLGELDVPEVPAALTQGSETADATASGGGAPTEPYDERLDVLRGIFTQVLEVEDVGIHDSFFALGGHSLLVIRLISRVRTALGVELDVAKVFEAPSVAELYACLDEAPRARPSLGAGRRSR
ncbi:condensation domain-containing protein [Streptomyces sp. NRRL S-87]|uniref:condensation domain-containing protein n=1 Tax=Streptomyces sp. NRRL S-87 TaxID=1463920 RepID=UPI0004BE4A28|nr:condensation domain-containing protein [Streptomyces sp. NRRL S-87]